MIAPAPLLSIALMAAAPASMAALRWDKRVLVVTAPGPQDPALREQRRIMARWTAAARDRDLMLLEVIGDQVTGVSDTAGSLRRQLNLPSDRFAVALVGKDGGAKLRQTSPIPSSVLEETIDAMPMRRAGKR